MTNTAQPLPEPIVFRPEMEHQEVNESVADAGLGRYFEGDTRKHIQEFRSS